MILLTRNNKQVEVEVSGDPDDPFVSGGVYVNAPWLPVPDSVFHYLESTYAGELAEYLTEELICKAEDWADFKADR